MHAARRADDRIRLAHFLKHRPQARDLAHVGVKIATRATYAHDFVSHRKFHGNRFSQYATRANHYDSHPALSSFQLLPVG